VKHCVLLVLFLCALILPSFYCEPAMADLEEPLIAMIVNESFESPGPEYNMYLNETATFIGLASGGNIPYYFSWFVDGMQVGASCVFSYAATELGDHSLVLVVHDLAGQEVVLTLPIHVYNPVVPVGSTTWGAIKSLFK